MVTMIEIAVDWVHTLKVKMALDDVDVDDDDDVDDEEDDATLKLMKNT